MYCAALVLTDATGPNPSRWLELPTSAGRRISGSRNIITRIHSDTRKTSGLYVDALYVVFSVEFRSELEWAIWYRAVPEAHIVSVHLP